MFKRKLSHRILPLLLALALLLGMLPTVTLAEEPEATQLEIEASYFHNSFVMPRKTLTVSSDLAEQYGYTDKNGCVSALDALVSVHMQVLGSEFTPETASKYLTVGDTGFITSAFGDGTGNISVAVNGAMPYDPESAYNKATGGYTGYLLPDTVLSSGDVVEFFSAQDSYWMDYYSWFEQDGVKTQSLTVQTGESFTLGLKGYMFAFCGAYNATDLAESIEPIESAQLATIGGSGDAFVDIAGKKTDKDGKVTLSFDTPGSYVLSAYITDGDIDVVTPIYAPWCVVTVEAPQAPTAPAAINIEYAGSQKTPNGSLIGKTGDSFPFLAYDETGNATPVAWSTSSSWLGNISDTGLFTATGSLSAGGTSSLYITATSTLDASVTKSETFSLAGYELSSYNKTQAIALSTDGQSAKTISVSGGYAGHTDWSYAIPDGIAQLSADPGKAASIKFNALRPGSFTARFVLDFNDQMTDTATVSITGVAVEDAEAKQGKTYLTLTEDAPKPSAQLIAYVADGLSVSSWSSSNERIAEVDAAGRVTAKAIGSAIISATDSEGSTGGIQLVVQSGTRPYFENLQFPIYSLSDWTADSFRPETLSYPLTIKAYSTSTLTLQSTTLYDSSKFEATASYTDANNVVQNVHVNSGTQTALPNIPFDSSLITITLADKSNNESKTVYTFQVTRPRDTTKAIKSSGIVLVPSGRNLLSTKYKGKAEGTMFRADENGEPSTNTGVTSSVKQYRCYALDGLQSFSLAVSSSTVYQHLRYSADGGATWSALSQGGGSTNNIHFPAGDATAKVVIQIVDDEAYSKSIKSGGDGFTGLDSTEYRVWIEQVAATSASAQLLTAKTDHGDWYPAFDPSVYANTIVVPNGGTAPTLSYTAVPGARVTLGGTVQSPDEDGNYTLALKSSNQTLSVTSADGAIVNSYALKYQANSAYAVPDAVTDYLCINSQYTNAGFGTAAEATLAGSVKSLGGFGGYITYHYKDALRNNPNNKFGIDFYVYGNANVDSSSGTGLSFFEPGQVWVSEDEKNWYALAGSAHYDEGVEWNYTVNYSKASNGKTAWTDSLGNSNNGAAYTGAWANLANYYMNGLLSADKATITGVMLPSSTGDAALSGAIADAYAVNWGYADAFSNGTIGADVNPYLDNSKHTLQANGFDLEWAVDAAGNPVNVSDKRFHYVKVQTASNIWHTSFGEKSTEVSYVVRSSAQESSVGRTKAPTGVTISDGAESKQINFVSGQQMYEANLGNMKYLSLSVNGAAAEDNIYINNQRIAPDGKATGIQISKKDGVKLIRVIVQNGDKEPLSYLLKLSSSADFTSQLIEGVKVNAGGAVRPAQTTNGTTYRSSVGYKIDHVGIVPIANSDVDLTVNGESAKESYALSYGENSFLIQGKKGDATHTVTLKITRANAPAITGTVNVSFRLLGDEVHGDSGGTHTLKNGGLQTWIPQTSKTVRAPATVLDVLEAALGSTYSYTNAGGNYISEINGLSEFSNGMHSGWLYTINGKYTSLGVAEQSVRNGDVLVFHYTDDYTKEQSADDWVEPPKADAPGGTTIAPTTTVVSGNTATVTLTDKTVADAIEAVKNNGQSSITIAPTDTGTAKIVSVTLSKTAAQDIVNTSSVSLVVATNAGTVSIPNHTLKSIAAQAGGSSISITVEQKTAAEIKTQSIDTTNAVIIAVTVKSDSAAITTFGGEALTISIPVTSKFTEQQRYTVLEISDDGTEQSLIGTCVKTNDKLHVQVSTTGLSTFVVSTQNPLPFTDVTDHWAIEGIQYAYNKGLFTGTSASSFSPDTAMTRAMLVTVLYRMEGSPAVTAADSFADAKSEQYYANAVLWASQNDIVAGYGNGLFGTDDPITREQLATILYRYAHSKKYALGASKKSNILSYDDASEISQYAIPATQWAVDAGLISGTNDRSLSPKESATRAQVATILMRFQESALH